MKFDDESYSDDVINQRNAQISRLVVQKYKALDLIYKYGGIDGAHHKAWVLDQIVRVLADDYDDWVRIAMAGADGPSTYTYDTGISP